MRRGDAFLYDHMLDYSNEYQEQEQNPLLRQLMMLNEMKNLEELAAQDDDEDPEDAEMLETEEELDRQIKEHEQDMAVMGAKMAALEAKKAD